MLWDIKWRGASQTGCKTKNFVLSTLKVTRGRRISLQEFERPEITKSEDHEKQKFETCGIAFLAHSAFAQCTFRRFGCGHWMTIGINQKAKPPTNLHCVKHSLLVPLSPQHAGISKAIKQ